ncbi:MAG TPA: cation:proton antiporter [Gemmatimonadaceae bacterium]|nr:cation:proton antiporter [Gemmatimonadaceae bacterium]
MHESSTSALLLALVAVILATKLLGELAQRAGQPAVLGELVAGVLLGGSVLGILQPETPVIAAFAELGVLVLLFEIGLHTDLRSLVGVGSAAVTVGLVGIALPFLLGFGAASLLGVATVPAIVCGAALTATSIGISARVLSDLGRLDTREGQVVIGAAVLDDVVGLIILSIVSAIAGGIAITVLGVTRITAVAIGFIVVALAVGRLLVPPLFRVVERIRVSGSLGLIALAFAFAMAWLANASGSAMIIGAFAAGLVLHRTPQRDEIQSATTTIGYFFVPIFFAAVGAQVDLRSLADPRALLIGIVLIAAGVVGKYAAGFAPFWFRGDKRMIGVSMIPRGEVGLIFAQMGLTTGALDRQLFSALTLMVMVTTFIAPVLLSRIVRMPSAPSGGSRPGDGGIDDLVAGTSTAAEPKSA